MNPPSGKTYSEVTGEAVKTTKKSCRRWFPGESAARRTCVESEPIHRTRDLIGMTGKPVPGLGVGRDG